MHKPFILAAWALAVVPASGTAQVVSRYAFGVVDFANPAFAGVALPPLFGTFPALVGSSEPKSGQLFPLGSRFFVNPAGQIGFGTEDIAEPAVHVEVQGLVPNVLLDSTNPNGDVWIRWSNQVATTINPMQIEWRLIPGSDASQVPGSRGFALRNHDNGEYYLWIEPDPGTEDACANIGVNMEAPTCALDVAGTVRATNFVQLSDARLKRNVRPLTGVLPRLDRVRAVRFQWNEGVADAEGRSWLGVLAQDFEPVFPEVVVAAPNAEGHRGVHDSGLGAVLLQAAKELKAEDEALRELVVEQGAAMAELARRFEQLAGEER
ncbi:MAG: tail fiber domain-containing protein [Planctomycetota bacterium]